MSEARGAPLDRSVPPEPGAVRPFDFPHVTASTLPGGLGLRVARMGQVPLVTFLVALKAGESWLQDHAAGLAVLTATALEGGTRKRGGPELAEALEGIGTNLSIRTGWDYTALSLTCLADRKEEALALLSEALLEPAFPQGEVDRVRSQRLAALRQRTMDPGSLADDSAVQAFYADSVPYHRPLSGTAASVEGLGVKDLRGFWESGYLPDGSGLVVVGDVGMAEVEALAGRFFSDWKGAPASPPGFQALPRSREGRIVVVDRPGAVQSEIRLGHVGAARSSPHFVPLQVFNTVLGGAFTSRLMLNLREDKGFTYGVRSRFSFRRGEGPFTISMAVATEVTGPAVSEALAELRGLLDGGPTREEVTQARDYLAGVFPLQLETTGQVASRIAELLVYEIRDDFFSTYRDEIRAVGLESALEAGRDVLRPQEMAAVVVGDARKVVGPLEATGLGPVEVLSKS